MNLDQRHVDLFNLIVDNTENLESKSVFALAEYGEKELVKVLWRK